MNALNRPTTLLLNSGHALDHMFLLIFATAVTSIAADFGFSRWEDLMPYGAGAFLLFGIGSAPSGRLGDLWGRRKMMIIFFAGMGLSAMLCGLVQNAWQMALALTLMGAFSSIYHPVGIPMLLSQASRPGLTIGVNGLAGNLGIAVAAIVTGLLVKYLGWRAAFVIPGLFCLACAYAFALIAPEETEPPARSTRKATQPLEPAALARLFLIMTFAAISSSLLFNFTTNGNGQLLSERFNGIVEDPAQLGALLALVYTIASLAQVIVGKLIDRFPMKRLYLVIVLAQIPLFLLAAQAQGWTLFWFLTGFMIMVFGAIPFTEAMVVRFVDDRLRSRVSGMRMAVSFGISSLAVYLLGPVVKAGGFATLLVAMAGIAACTAIFVLMLPDPKSSPAAAAATATS